MAVQEILDHKHLVFHLGEEEYVIPVHSISFIERMLKITRVPSVDSYIKGVMNLRGVIIPVIDVKEQLFHSPTEITDQTRIIIVHHGDISVGLIVEAANDVVDILPNQIEATPEVVGSVKTEYVQGVVHMDGHLYILLELERMLDKEMLNKKIIPEG